jgi:hypothetical protein
LWLRHPRTLPRVEPEGKNAGRHKHRNTITERGRTMRAIICVILVTLTMAVAGCYPVGHRYHDPQEHQQSIDQMNNPDPPTYP